MDLENKTARVVLLEKNDSSAEDASEIRGRFLAELKRRIERLEIVDKDFPELQCEIFYGFKDWAAEKCLCFSKNGVKMSQKQDIKCSVMLSSLSAFVNNNSGSFAEEREFIQRNRIRLFLRLANPNEKKEESMEKNDTKENAIKNFSLIAEKPRFHFEQLIVNDEVSKELRDTVKLIKNRSKIYYDWGFSEIDSVPHCVVNFYGEPGTGKTMSAHILADELGVKILPLNYADIESKYVGDAPKNLVAAFDCAKEQNALLFFDEADSFLGKRITNVSTSSDQAVNSLRSQLLMLLEARDTIVVFATNLQENYDTAFNSRILKHIKFVLPDAENRKKILKKMIPSKVPLADDAKTEEFYSKISEFTDGFAPREIKNAVLNTLIRACDFDKAISADVFYDVFAHEKQMHDDIKKKSLRKKELGEKIKQNIDSNNYAVVKQQTEEHREI